MKDRLLQNHKEVLEMFYRLISSGHHRHFLGGSYDRVFEILLPYIREPLYQHTIRAASSRLIIMSLATLQDRIPPNAVTQEDAVVVRECVFSASDSIISPPASALVFSMVLTLPFTDGSCSEDLSEAVCSIITTTFRNDVSREALMGIRILPSFHAYLSSLEALLRMNPTFLTEHAWKDLVATGSCLAADDRLVFQCDYMDSYGRSIGEYLDSIPKLRRGLEVPPPSVVRRQTLTPDVAVIIQGPVTSSESPPEVKFHWPSWFKLSSPHDKTDSTEDLPL